MDTKSEIIGDIIKKFDFASVFNYIKAADLEFFDGKNMRKPNLDDLKKISENLLEKAYHEKEFENYSVSYGTCGFEATKTKDGMLYLRYIIDEAELDLDQFLMD